MAQIAKERELTRKEVK